GPRQERVHGRHEQPPGRRRREDFPKALERGGRRLDKDRRHQPSEAAAHVGGAVLFSLVEDHGGPLDAGGLEMGKDVGDERLAGHCDERLGRPEGRKPRPLAGGDDGARPDHGHGRPARQTAGRRTFSSGGSGKTTSSRTVSNSSTFWTPSASRAYRTT